jgi:hypothetical protein
MEISVTAGCLKEVAKRLGADAIHLGYNFTFKRKKDREKLDIDLDNLALEHLEILRAVMKEKEEDEIRRVSRLINVLKDPAQKKIESVEEFATKLIAYLKENDWPLLHSVLSDQRGVAYVPYNVTFVPEVKRDRNGYGREEYATLNLAYNIRMSHSHETHNFSRRQVIGMTLPQILRARNLLVPDKDMTEDYEKVMSRFADFGSQQGEQFLCRGHAYKTNGHRWWSSSTVSMMNGTTTTRAIIDFGRDEDNEEDNENDRSMPVIKSDLTGKMVIVPTHPMLPVFSMAHHCMVWINVINMRVYKYEEDLMDKLILPKSHTRLIGALISNLDALRDENDAENKSKTIKAKASASVILAKGKPGTGKTLTAEVYANEMRRPLYEIQSGQIGSRPEQIEENLSRILQRSARLRMPLLINEADVFIKERGDDPVQNAIVAVFLRLLEYHNGLVFLTSNRGDQIDDAFLSRCLAVIQFDTPKPAERLRLWKLMLKEFNVELSVEETKKAVLYFPEVAGRDIQNLIRLTHRVCKAVEDKFTLTALCENAIFKDIKVLTEKELEAEIAKHREARAATA